MGAGGAGPAGRVFAGFEFRIRLKFGLSVAADARFYSQVNEKKLQAMGVKNVSVPSRNIRREQRRLHREEAIVQTGPAPARTGCEGRISILKRRRGLTRCRYRGQKGMKRWVGLGVIADNPINMGLCLAK
jgi:IS5 family transposase